MTFLAVAISVSISITEAKRRTAVMEFSDLDQWLILSSAATAVHPFYHILSWIRWIPWIYIYIKVAVDIREAYEKLSKKGWIRMNPLQIMLWMDLGKFPSVKIWRLKGVQSYPSTFHIQLLHPLSAMEMPILNDSYSRLPSHSKH